MSISKLLKGMVPQPMAGIKPYIRSSLDNIDDYARLDAMESPYGIQDLPQELQAKWLDSIQSTQANRYPPQLSQATIDKLYKFLNIPAGQSFIAGNGSDEIILLLMLLCGTARGGKVLSPSPSFSMYKHMTQALGGEFIEVGLEDDLTLDLSKLSAAIEEHQPQLVFLAQPNNPTGRIFTEETATIAAELLKDSGLVVVDRAYEFFLKPEDKTDSQDAKYDNIVNLYTLSKIGFAGLRFGFAVANEEITYELSKLRLPYNINSLTCASIEMLADNLEYFRKYADDIITSRDQLSNDLSKLDGLEVFPSHTNFILLKLLGENDSTACTEYLQKQKVLVKDFGAYHPLLQNCIRVSIGLEAENALFLQSIKDYIGSNS